MVGFYLVHLGFVLLRIRTGVIIDSKEQLIVYQAQDPGVVLFVLGLMRFFNMYVIHRLSKSGWEIGKPKRLEPTTLTSE